METEGDTPARVDASYLSNLPWSAQNEFKQACRSLGLVDDQDQPTQLLRDLALKPDERQARMADLLRARYPGPMSLGKNATGDQLEEAFKKMGVKGSTLQKALRFYLQAAQYAEIELSPHFKTPKTSSAPRKPRTRRKNESNNGNAQEDKTPKPDTPALHPFLVGLLQELPSPNGSWTAAKRQAWLEIAERTVDMLYKVDDAPAARKASPNPEGGESSR
jgi:hypothetical protein